ncbi:MAG: hypothetical protein JKY19_06450 [Alcanivoracaceae bacterium]|nr:hypothetical protein [Alcanivoracaceae bacterium]
MFAKTEKVDQILIVQNQINQAYKLGYVDAAPVEMSFVEKKVIEAKAARDDRKKKLFIKLIEQIKVDLAIVKKRFEVNQLHQQLSKLQSENLQSKKMLDELREQL